MKSLEIRKLIVKLRNEDKLLIGYISKALGKSKSGIHVNLRKFEETSSCKTQKLPELLRGKAGLSEMNQKGSVCDSNHPL